MSKIAFLFALGLGAAALMPAAASAKSGPGISSRTTTGLPAVTRQQVEAKRPMLKFTNVKLLKCHTYVRGHGDNVTVCN